MTYIINDIEPHFNHGLGEFVKSRQHMKQIMKEKGLQDIGNEKIPKPKKKDNIDWGEVERDLHEAGIQR